MAAATSRSRSSSKVATSEDDADEIHMIRNQRREDEIAQIGRIRNPRLPSAIAVSRIRSALATAFSGHRPKQKVVGTLFGHRNGNVNFVFQREHASSPSPVFFVEVATPITTLVAEMASGLVRIALECDKPEVEQFTRSFHKKPPLSLPTARSSATWRASRRLLDEPVWRAFCNGKKCGFANKREPGSMDQKALKMLNPVSMGAGVLPGFNGSGLSGSDGEMMYMRAKFERVVGSRDSEAFYMMNPDFGGSPELSIYLLRV